MELIKDAGEKVKSQVKVKDKQEGVNKNLKGKRVDEVVNHDKESHVTQCQEELDELFDYYKGFSGLKLQLDVNFLLNSQMIAFFAGGEKSSIF